MSTLSGPYHSPASGGAPDSVIIMLHGIGSDGHDLISLANVLAPDLPNTAFHAPDAPEPYAGGFGYEWFPRAEMAGGGHAKRVEDTLNAYIDEVLAEYALDSSRCVLLGFSQGSIVAMHVAPRRAEAVAGVVAFSGSMPTAGTLLQEKVSAPPMLLIHGAEDTVLGPEESETAAKHLQEAGVPVTLHVLPGLPHSIDGRGIGLAAQFLQQVLTAG
ncbi:MAG: dienelactone hydrolase family protein [Dehalococcoidia bacterium]